MTPLPFHSQTKREQDLSLMAWKQRIGGINVIKMKTFSQRNIIIYFTQVNKGNFICSLPLSYIQRQYFVKSQG